jgi:hypothetical protein
MRCDERVQLIRKAMSIFDESSVEAGHKRLASSISTSVEALAASTDLIRKVVLYEDKARIDAGEHADYLTASILSCRIVNDVGAATKLLDCGYFTQAASMYRDISETAMLMMYFSERPEELKIWREAGESRYKKFSRGNLSVNIADKKRFDFFNKYFNSFSEFGTHPSPASIVAHLSGNQRHIGPHVNEELYILLYRDLSILVWDATDICGIAYKAIFKDETESIFPSETARFRSAWQIVADIVSTNGQS